MSPKYRLIFWVMCLLSTVVTVAILALLYYVLTS